MALYDHEGTRGLAPLSILGQPPLLNQLSNDGNQNARRAIKILACETAAG